MHTNSGMFTLFIFMTQDGWISIYNRMDDKGLGVAGAIYSFLYIIIGALMFANIIVGVTVTNLQTAYKETKAQRKVSSGTGNSRGVST